MRIALVEVASLRFPPLSKEALKNEIELSLGQRPEHYGCLGCRWTLKSLRHAVHSLHSYTLGGVWALLHSLKVRHVRARAYVHSPDPLYGHKYEYLQKTIREHSPQTQKLYFLDQLTVYLHPSVGYDWTRAAEAQPLARQGYSSNRTFRLCGAVDCFSGEVEILARNKISVAALIEFFGKLTQKNPGKTIYLVLDNWTLHWHPDVRAALEPQLYPFSITLPASWQNIKVKKKYIGLNLPVQLVYLPTYASWLNPIEKVWKWLKQDIIHLHRLTDDFDALKQKVLDWFLKPERAPDQILRYIGLGTNDGIYSKAIQFAISQNLKERFFS